jgi:CxxC-x17-CxxC domain-containing protein
MNTFNRGGGKFKSGGNTFGGGGRSREGKRFGGGGSRAGSGEMYKATCSDCGKACEVPFRPSGDKPVFCSDCFGRKQFDGNRGPSRRHEDARSRPQFRHASARPDVPRKQADDGLSDIKRQLSNLEQKLNRILDIINPPQPSMKASRPEVDTGASMTPRAEKKNRPNAVAKKVPSEADIKIAVANAMAADEKEKAVKKLAKKASAKVASKKAVTKKTKK